MKRPIDALLLWSALALAGCSSADGPAADQGIDGPATPDGGGDATADTAGPADLAPDVAPPLTADGYCERVTPGYCAFYLRCGRIAAADVEACAAVATQNCNGLYEPVYAALVDAGLLEVSEDGVEACLTHLASAPCDRVIGDLDGPCAGMWVGQQPAGAPCGIGIESLVCAPGNACVLSLSFCGVCRPVAAPGEACGSASAEEVSCGGEAMCREGQCVARGQPGDPCGPDTPCVLGARCVAGTCAPPPLAAEGQACSKDLRCVRLTSCVGGTCQPNAAIGEACGPQIACDTGRCAEGKCAARLRPGETCQSPADCLSGTCTGGRCAPIPGGCFTP